MGGESFKMAVIELNNIPSFENNLKNTTINKVNYLGVTQICYGVKYIPIIIVSDQNNNSLLFFEEDGIFYGSSSNKEIKDIQSFKDLGIQTIDGLTDYLPELTLIDTSCNSKSKIHVVDKKLNIKDLTQHVVEYALPQYSHKNPKNNGPFTLEDVIIQTDNQEISHFSVSESRSYDPNYGGYPLTFYAINDKEEVLEFNTKDYRNKIFVNPQSLVWKPTVFNQKKGFVRLTENSYYWGGKEELIYAFGLEKNISGNFFFLDLVNSTMLQPGYPAHSIVNKTPNKIELNFGNHIDFNLPILPKFDSASCLDDKEFLIAMVPVINGNLDNSCRDIYWFRLTGSRDEAISLADPYRITNIDRFDNVKNGEKTISIRHMKQSSTSEDIVYMITCQDIIQKFRIELKP